MTMYHAREHRRSRIPGLIDPYAIGMPWYLSGGIDLSNCAGAYRAKGVVSYAASKINLANPGTYDLIDGSIYPTWAESTGWTFASGAFLRSVLTIDQKPGTYIIRLKTLNQSGYRTVIGGYSGSNGISLDLTNGSNVPRLLIQDAVLIGSGTSGFGATVDTVIAMTYSSSGVWTHYLNGVANGTGTNNQTPSSQTMMIGGQYNGQNYSGDILGVSFYNIDLPSAKVKAVSDALALV